MLQKTPVVVILIPQKSYVRFSKWISNITNISVLLMLQTQFQNKLLWTNTYFWFFG